MLGMVMYTFNLRMYSSNLRPKIPCSIATQHIGGRGRWLSELSLVYQDTQDTQGYAEKARLSIQPQQKTANSMLIMI